MKALLVIDMQKGSKKTFAGLYNCKKMVKHISKLIDAFSKNKQKVIQIKLWITNPKQTTMLQKCPGCGIAGTKGAEIFDELKDKSYDKIIKKTNYSGFWKTSLDAYLRKNKINEIYLAGIHAGACILFTAVDAFYRGYHVFVVEDAVSSVTNKKGLKEKIRKIKELCAESITTTKLLKKLRI